TISPEAEGWISQDALKPPKKGPTLPEKEVKVTGDGLTDAQIAALKTALSTTPVPTDDITALGLNNAKQVYQAAQLAQDALNAEIAKGSPDPALIEQLAREASSLEALGDRMTDQYPPDGQLPTGTVATVDANGFAKAADAATGDTLLSALNFPDPGLLSVLQNGIATAIYNPQGATSPYTIVSDISTASYANYDQPAIDPGTGKLSQSELEAVTSLYLNNLRVVGLSNVTNYYPATNITSLDGLELFPNLETLQAMFYQIGSFNPQNNLSLKDLDVSCVDDTSIDLTHNTELEYLSVIDSKITNFDLSQNTKLKAINVANSSNLKSVNFSANKDVVEVRVNQCPQLTSINVNGLDKLESLIMYNSGITSFDAVASGLTSVKEIRAYWTVAGSDSFGPLRSLNVAGLTNLQTLQLYNQSLTSLNLTGCTGLTTMNAFVDDSTFGNLGNGSLTSITGLTDCTALTGLQVYNQSLSSLDISALNFTYNNSAARFYNNNLTSLKVPTGTLANWQNTTNAANAYYHLRGNFGGAPSVNAPGAPGEISGVDTSKITE
ncbi:MAG: hypothetical protein FWD65_02250, partial [Coriobacteriia bacterium]|nr:hypothetical protein [Coriobacteriia bacterium]